MGIRAPVLLSMLLFAVFLSAVFLSAVFLSAVFLSAGRDPGAGAPSPSGAGPDLSVPESPSPNAGADSLPDARILVRGVVVDDEGRPLRGAEVLVSAESGEAEAPATTDARGAFSARVLAGTRALRFHKSGRVPVGVCLDAAVAGDLRVRLRRGVTLRGVVLSGADREPVSGARVHVDSWPHAVPDTVSGKDGTFSVDGIPSGKWVDVDVDAGPRGWVELHEVVPAWDGELEVLLPSVCTVSGRVRDQATGEPVVGVAVSAWAGVGHSYISGACADGVRRQGEPATSGSDGRFRIPGVVRRAFLRVESDAWFLLGEEPSFRDGDDPVEVFVARRSVVSGTVSAPDGSAVAGAEVRADGRTTTADADGRFSLRGVGLRGDATEVRAVSPGPGVQLSGSVQLRYTPGTEVTDLALLLREDERKRVPVSGVLLAEDGGRIRGAEIHAFGETVQEGYTRVRSGKVQSGADGRFDLLLDGDVSWSTRISAYGFVPRRVEFETGPDAPLVLEPIRLVALVPRRGTVVDEAGNAVPSADFKVWDGRPEVLTPVGRDGSFTVWTAPGDDWRVEVEAPGYGDAKALGRDHPAGEDLVIRLRRSYEVRGRLLDLEGRPVAGVGIHGTGGAPVVTDLSGRFRFDRDEPGADRILVGHSDHTFPKWVEIEAGAGEVEIHAVRPCTLGGIVLYADGSPAVGARVRVEAEDAEESHHLKTGEDGRFEFRGLAARIFTVRVDRLRPDFYSSPLRSVPGDSKDLRIVFARGESIWGAVEYPDGRPAFAVQVGATPDSGDPDIDSESDLTDEEGRFRIRGLRPGSWTVDAWNRVEGEVSGEDGETEDVYWEAQAVGIPPGTRSLRLVLRPVIFED